MSVLTTATGLCVLAHLDRPSRDALLAAIAVSPSLSNLADLFWLKIRVTLGIG